MLSAYKRLAIATVVGSAGLLWGHTATASDLADAPPRPVAETAPPAAETAPLPAAEPAIELESPGDVEAAAEPLVCPPGQFASTFADVYPFHWAYDAVNSLAAPPMQCFDWPEEYL